MNFDWDTAQAERRQQTLAFAREELEDDRVSRDAAGEFPTRLWKACAAFGIQAMAVPSQYHNFGDTNFLTAMLVMEALGEGCRDNALAFSLNAHMWTVAHPLARHGSEAQKARYLTSMADGSIIGAHAMTEPESGSDAFAMSTTAQPTTNGYVLSGHKAYISHGPIADVALVFANTNPDVGKWGVSAFVVDLTLPGIERGPVRQKMGLRSVPMCDLIFSDCEIGTDSLLGPEGAGASLSTSFLEYERCCILASQVGAMARQLNECIAFARHRKQFGQAIGRYQSVANRIVDMKLRLETAQLLLYRSAWQKAQDRNALMDTSLLKLHISEAFLQSSLDAVRIHGGKGYLSEFETERDLRDAVGGTIYAGTSDIQRNIVARLLGL